MFLLFSFLFSSGQNIISNDLNDNTFYLKNKLKADTSIHFVSASSSFADIENVMSSVSANFSTCNYGFFCREELKLEKTIKLPFRFRLGSLEQCNYYEGKKR
ncbi:hypothetical protein FW778_11715 [Ginsengibacter hankyongi]|uniref:Uncharacterized protein n=1 Tax=Ginsengibacter hankyongi TaxID=2607284 RepID=A0A5J5IKD6_9BACT|nr:hypothetical protein [Ginsengibacter hankyongi]KAA9039479.1 hypothetical protein FW778_11715 [Ginsengibacter hankyongi]